MYEQARDVFWRGKLRPLGTEEASSLPLGPVDNRDQISYVGCALGLGRSALRMPNARVGPSIAGSESPVRPRGRQSLKLPDRRYMGPVGFPNTSLCEKHP